MLLWPSPVMTSSPSTVAMWRHGDSNAAMQAANNGCYYSESLDGGVTVRCSAMGLTQVSEKVSE